MYLHYTEAGFLILRQQDNLHRVIDAMLETGYNEEFCVSLNFDSRFITQLMKAGFLVMSSRLAENEDDPDWDQFVLLPKLHLVRSALFFDKLHIKKSVKRYLNRYELRFDSDFDSIVDRCLEKHGNAWLTPPLVAAIREIRQKKFYGAYPASFALYRNGKLVAGEFGIIAGKVYTSYSGYYDENNAGTVQLILTTHYLRDNGFAFFDLGMPLDYKTDLGAVDLSPQEFVDAFRMGANE